MTLSSEVATESIMTTDSILTNIDSTLMHNPAKEGKASIDSKEIGQLLWIYWSPFTFFLGLIGNALVIKIFGFSKSGHITTTSTTSIYFTVMAIADSCFLIFGIVPEWLEASFDFKLKETHYVMCKIEKFLFYTSGDVSIWIICITTMDRFIAVCFPYTQQTFRKAKYAVVSSIVTLSLAIIKNLHVFWTRGPEYKENGELLKVCGRPKPYDQFEFYIRPWIAFVLVAILPFALLLIFNIFIIRFFVHEQLKVRLTSNRHRPDFKQTIIMCVAVSVTFLVLVTPSLILYIGKPYWTRHGDNHIYDIGKAVGNQLSYVNHSINFLLYCITARKFRDEALKIVFPKKIREYCCVKARDENAEFQSIYKNTIGQTSHDQNINCKFSSEKQLNTISDNLNSSAKGSQDQIFTISKHEANSSSVPNSLQLSNGVVQNGDVQNIGSCVNIEGVNVEFGQKTTL